MPIKNIYTRCGEEKTKTGTEIAHLSGKEEAEIVENLEVEREGCMIDLTGEKMKGKCIREYQRYSKKIK